MSVRVYTMEMQTAFWAVGAFVFGFCLRPWVFVCRLRSWFIGGQRLTLCHVFCLFAGCVPANMALVKTRKFSSSSPICRGEIGLHPC